MPKDNIIAGLDIGTCNIRFVIAQIKEGDDKPHILGVAQVPSTGLNKGVIIDIPETVSAIGQAKAIAERISGHTVDGAYVSVNGNHVNAKPAKSVIAVSRADGEISHEDVNRVIGAVSADTRLLQNRDVLHVLPRFYLVDNQDKIKDPVGMSGIRLEIDALLIDGFAPNIKNLTKCVEQAGLAVRGYFLAPLAASEAVLTKRQKEMGVVTISIGGGTTGLTIFEEGNIIHTQVLPIGSLNITKDIAIGLRVSMDLAEKIKIEYGSVIPEEISKKDIIDLSKLGEGEGSVSRQYIAEIIEARTSEIFGLISKELKKIDREALLPSGAVLVGGGAKMPGLVDFAKKELRLNAQIGFPLELKGIADQVDDPSFATVIGLTLAGFEKKEKNDNLAGISSNKTVAQFAKWFRKFLP